MAKLYQRAGALILAVLFFVTASATAVFVIYETTQQNKNPATAANAPAAPDSSFCSQSDTAHTTGQPTIAAPEVYKPTAKLDSLQVKDVTAGDGEAAKSGDCLYVKYYGTLAADGKVFDENFSKDTAFKFVLGQGQVIAGWDQGLSGLKVNGVRQLAIPANLAYGSNANGQIPANSDLVFVVKLLRVEHPSK